MKLVYVFPGQASQYVGMGKDLWDSYPQVREQYERTNEILGMDIAQLSFQGPEEQLVQTDNTQPAIFAHSLAIYLLLKERGLGPDIVAGHSLGEYSALAAAGALPYEETLRLVLLRGRLMKEAGARLVQIGIESGDPQLRREVLGRNVSNDEIVQTFEDAHAVGLETSSFNMVGIILVMVTLSRAMVERMTGGSKSLAATCFPPTHVMANVAQASAK